MEDPRLQGKYLFDKPASRIIQHLHSFLNEVFTILATQMPALNQGTRVDAKFYLTLQQQKFILPEE